MDEFACRPPPLAGPSPVPSEIVRRYFRNSASDNRAVFYGSSCSTDNRAEFYASSWPTDNGAEFYGDSSLRIRFNSPGNFFGAKKAVLPSSANYFRTATVSGSFVKK